MPRSSARGGSSSSGGFGSGGPKIATGYQDAAPSVAQQTLLNRRLNMLMDNLPGMSSQPEVLLRLAQSNMDDATMLDSALKGIGFAEVHRLAEEMGSWSDDHKRAEWGVMSPQKQAALQAAGFQPPPPPKKKGGGLWDAIKTGNPGLIAYEGIGAGVKTAATGIGMITGAPVIKQGLAAFNYLGEESSRIPRAGEYLMDARTARERLEASGQDPDQVADELGIYLPESDMDYRRSFYLPWAPPVMLLSDEYWKTWNHNGHEGDDDFLATKQIEAYYDLEEADAGSAVENFNLARQMASGKDFSDIAEEAGYLPGTGEYQQYITTLAEKTADPNFTKVVDKLVGARLSPGRAIARQIGADNTTTGVGKWVSGSADAFYSVFMDPTIVGGKVSKAAGAARWAIRSGEEVSTLNRWRQLALIAEADEKGLDVAADLAKMSRRSPVAARAVSAERDLMGEGRAVLRPAQAIARAFDPEDSYTLANLARDLPQAVPAMDHMREFHNKLVAETGTGLTSVDKVFDFYTDAAAARAIGGSRRLFGINPDHLVVPHLSKAGQGTLKSKQWFRRLLIDGRPQKGLADAVSDATRAEMDEVPPGGFDVDMNWQPEERGKVKQFLGAFTTHVAGRSVNLEGAKAVEDFSRLVEYGSFAKMPRATMDRYFDVFVKGNKAQRAAIVNQFLGDFFSHAGFLDEAGQDFAQKYVNHAKQAYGIRDEVALVDDIVTRDAIFSNQLSDMIAVPDFKELLTQTRRANQFRAVFSGIRESQLESFIGKAWKPLQMMRIGFIFRNAGEEVLSFSLRHSAADYFKAKVASEWMEAKGSAAIAANPEMAQSAFLRPVTALTYGMRQMLGIGDEALQEAAEAQARTLPEFLEAADDVSRQAVIDRVKAEQRQGRRFVPRSVEWIDLSARWMSRTSSKAFHEIAQAAHLPTKQEIGTKLAGGVGGDLHLSGEMIFSSPLSHHYAESLGRSTFQQATGLDMAGPGRYTVMYDPASPSGLKQMKMKVDRSNFQEYGHAQIGEFYHAYAGQLDSVSTSVQGKAGMKVLSAYLPPTVRKDLTEAFGDDAPKRLRDLVHSASDADKAAVRQWLKTGKTEEALESGELAEALDKLAGASTRTRAWLSPDSVPYVTDNLSFVRDNLRQEIYAGLRRLDNEDVIRKMVRVNAGVDNVLPEGVSRLYVPMVDRRAAEGIAAVLSTTDGADLFAKHLEAQLSKRGLKRMMGDVWDATTPGASGFSVADLMDSIRGKQVMDGGEWVPASMAASSNADVAFAVRDAIADTFDDLGVPQVITPTIGYIDSASDQLTEAYGVRRFGEVFHVDPPKAVKATAIDPQSINTHLKVRTPDGNIVWVSESEADNVLGPGALEDGNHKVLAQIVGSGVTEDLAVRQAADLAADNLMQMLATRNGEVQHELLHHLNAGDFDMSDLWTKGKVQDMPSKAYGPQMVTPSDGWWEKVVSRWFDGLANPAIGALSREPIFRFNVSKALHQTRTVFDNLADKDLADRAGSVLAKVGASADDFQQFNRHLWSRLDDAPVEGDEWHALGTALRSGDLEGTNQALTGIFGKADLSPEDLAILRDWSANQSMAWGAWRDASLERGFQLTYPYIDDHRIRSQFQEYIGSMIPFWYSEEQFLKRMARTFKQTPEALRKGQLMMNGLRSMGTVRRDEDGNEVFVYPGSQIALRALSGVTELLTGGQWSLPTSMQLTSRTANMIPGYNADQVGRMNFGPVIGMPVEFMARRFPEWEEAQEKLFHGQVANRSYIDYLVPSVARNLYTTFMADPDKSNLASAQLQAAQLLEATGHGLPDDATPAEKEAYLEKLRGTARTVGMVRTITGFVGFAQATPVDDNTFSEEFSKLLQQGVEMQDAVAVMMERHGPEVLPYTVFGTKRADTSAPLPATAEADRWMTENADYIKAYPAAAAWLLPQEEEGDRFSYKAYTQTLALGLRLRRSPEEMIEAIQVAQAAPGFFDAKREYDALIAAADAGRPAGRPKSQEVKDLEQQWRIFRDGFYAQHPVFAEQQVSAAGRDRRSQTLEEMRKIVNDPGAPQSRTLDSLREVVNAYWEYRQTLSMFDGVRGARAQQMKKQLTEQFLLRQWLNETPQSKGFFASIIMPDIDADEVPLTRPAGG
jgi:hypothetical protein